MMIPFRDKSIYHWQFDGSYSIKVVLPALVPELSYDNLDISDGGDASSAWLQMVESKDEEEKTASKTTPSVLWSRYFGNGQDFGKNEGNGDGVV